MTDPHTDPHDTYVLGNTVHREFLTYDGDGNLAGTKSSTGLTLTRLTPPAWTEPGTDLTAAVVELDAGTFAIDDVPDAAGRHIYRWRTTTPDLAVDQVVVLLAGDGARATLAELKAYMNTTSWTDPELVLALAAEQSAQDARCRWSSVYPVDLRLAVYRRVARHLALRSLPLAVSATESGSLFAPHRDPEVRRLEAPYARLAVG